MGIAPGGGYKTAADSGFILNPEYMDLFKGGSVKVDIVEVVGKGL
ncbi:hypothetical protein FRUB_09830 [Fimbriiglobus ruber]|uniref:Uncharacterized protein n=1 Tax=Fimbriiglobus ruber TaxID=1908690 RepID=A0A225D8X6_9BACT|nr:hypothetical protein FRUB_09830 [Fimbriiglobus ruber]